MAGIYILNLSARLLMLFTAARFRKRCFAPAKGVVPGARGCIIWWCCEFVSHGDNRSRLTGTRAIWRLALTTDQRRHRWSIDAANDLQQDRLL
ncbi:hypothetical protein [Paraburkholderia hospita]|uniref:hypothetical protein n=1 Tax=Paraburkholderia hospita TaxID=169430 RepID=UPI00103AB49C|nr:hypothetical protein [Paraburkholderia hospita]